MSATLFELRDGAAWIRLNRPENRNALSAPLVNELYHHLQQANQDSAVRCIVLTGSGPAFCAGADLKSPPGQTIEGTAQSVPFVDLLKAILDSPKPVIAAVNGAAFGGGLGLLAAADIVVATEDAQFSFSEVRLGVIPAVISVVCVPKLGAHQAMRLFLTGERFSGSDAVTLGLAHQAVPAGQLEQAVASQIELIKLAGPQAVIEAKQLVRSVPHLERDAAFEETAAWSVRMFNSEEAAEGMTAFREKRKPSWQTTDSGQTK